MQIFLLRHADHPHNVIGGWSDVDLTEFGKHQATEIVDFFAKNKNLMQITHVISSGLNRAQKTLLPTAQALGLKIEVNEDWNGLNQGELNGCSIEQAQALYPYLNLWSMEWNETFPQGESPQIFYNRVIKAWKDLFTRYKDNDNLLICTHGINMVVLESYLRGKKWNHREKNNFYPCVLITIDTAKQKISMQKLSEPPRW